MHYRSEVGLRDLDLTPEVESAWNAWLSVTRDRCHLHFVLEGGDLKSHLAISQRASDATANRVAADIAPLTPRRILEVGSSVGWNCIALARRFPQAEVHSVEPDAEAVDIARSMAAASNLNYHPLVGGGEELPYADGHFDLIICHQVIEHVADVRKVVSEMARVLSREGCIHLEAPNYRWPYEPHLAIWTIPTLGKPFVKATAVIQGKGQHLSYLNHLQFVTPSKLERLFRQHGLVWENRAATKLRRIVEGEDKATYYRGLARMLKVAGRLGVGRPLIDVVVATGIHSSVLYTIRWPPTRR